LKIANRIFKNFVGIFNAISIISITVLIVLNTTIVYRYEIQKYKLTEYTQLSAEILMDNYKRMINYVQNPLKKELVFNNLAMSNFGEIHFSEVKRIFMYLYIISIIFISIIIFKIVTNRNKHLGKKFIKSLNSSVNIIVLILVFISIMASINFSKTFYFFHKIFFRNDYWIFDPVADPIINALPQEFFMTELILIISLLILFTIVIKVIYYKKYDNYLIVPKSK
jgi:integral membrane protein (TIGR01906 family)